MSSSTDAVRHTSGCLTLLERLDILEIYFIFSTGNPGILLEFCPVSWEFYGAMALVTIDVMQLWMSMRFFP